MVKVVGLRNRLRNILCVLAALAVTAAQANVLQGVRMHEAPDHTRVVLDTAQPADYKLFTLDGPPRVVVDLSGTQVRGGFDPSVVGVGRDRIETVRGAQRADGYRLVLELKKALSPRAFTLAPVAPHGHRLVIDLYGKSAPTPVVRSAPKARRDIIIAVDAGHGGDDPGAIAANKQREKNIVLQIAQRIVRRINAEEGFSAVLVRKGDYYISLRKRTEIARDARADLFISVHADAFTSASVSGASVYTLSDRGASSETARWLAAKENRADLIGGVGAVSLEDKDPVLRSVLLDLSMDANRSASIEAGKAILGELGGVVKLHKNRVEQAGFVVLKSPDVPSILIETGYLSNPAEARRLTHRDHQNKIAKAVVNGIKSYMTRSPPPGTLIAARMEGNRDAAVSYTISRGDTVSEIAERFGISARSLRQANDLQNDRIRIGQVLKIPPS